MTDGPITEINRDLIQDLLQEAGRIMEDLSPELALVLPVALTEVKARVDRVHQAGEDILALACAMRSLIRLIGNGGAFPLTAPPCRVDAPSP